MLMIPRHDVHEPVGFAFARYYTKRSTTSRNGPKSLTCLNGLILQMMAVFLSLVCWIDLIWHIVLVLNVFQHLPTLPCHDISFKNDTGHDIMQKSQECVFE